MTETAIQNVRDLDAQKRIDLIQSALLTCPQAATELVHRFTPGIYIRELRVPAGALVVTKIHRTEHPFVISKGRVSVWTEEDGLVTLQAPHCGVTKPGTRRVAYAHEDLVWTTFHATTEIDLEKIEVEIIEPRMVDNVPLGAIHTLLAQLK